MKTATVRTRPPKPKSPAPGKRRLKWDIRASFATALRNWRQTHNLTLNQVATDLGLSASTINLWEQAKRFPAVRHFDLVAAYTRVPPCRLICLMADDCLSSGCPSPDSYHRAGLGPPSMTYRQRNSEGFRRARRIKGVAEL